MGEQRHLQHALAGQDPNRRGATSHTHTWAWLRFCIAIIYCSTGSQVKGKKNYSWVLVTDLLSKSKRGGGGGREEEGGVITPITPLPTGSSPHWSPLTLLPFYNSHLPFLPQFCSLVNSKLFKCKLPFV